MPIPVSETGAMINGRAGNRHEAKARQIEDHVCVAILADEVCSLTLSDGARSHECAAPPSRAEFQAKQAGGMTVLRIVANMAAASVPEVRKFYADLFGLDLVMDLGWVVTLASGEPTVPQISILGEGGSGAPVPDVSIEVDDVDEVYRRAKALGCTIVHDLVDEPWGVRRFFIADPTGKVINVLSHLG
jgi:predicted enzyme related to lactoylglutathione lyase